MKELKSTVTTVRLNERQASVLEKMVEQGLAKNKSEAIQYLINKHGILNS